MRADGRRGNSEYCDGQADTADAVAQALGVSLGAAPEQKDTRKECTCLETCRGPERLGEGWKCGLGREKPRRAAIAPERNLCGTCGVPASKHDAQGQRWMKHEDGRWSKQCDGFRHVEQEGTERHDEEWACTFCGAKLKPLEEHACYRHQQ
jgi:hypothetical protein